MIGGYEGDLLAFGFEDFLQGIRSFDVFDFLEGIFYYFRVVITR